MATAIRVPQYEKRVETVRTDVTKTFLTTEVNGRERRKEQVSEEICVSPDVLFVAQPDRVRLDLSLDEAWTIRAVAALVGGFSKGRRGDMDAISAALNDAEVPTGTFHPDTVRGQYYQGINFRNDGRTPYPGSTPSSDVGTGASPIECKTAAPSLLRPAVDLSAKVAEAAKVSTTGSGYTSDRAQRDAQMEKKIHAMLMGQW